MSKSGREKYQRYPMAIEIDFLFQSVEDGANFTHIVALFFGAFTQFILIFSLFSSSQDLQSLTLGHLGTKF
jgi:hypothetical protein